MKQKTIGIPIGPVILVTVIEFIGIAVGTAGIVLILLANTTVGAVLIALCCILGLIGSLLLRKTLGFGRITD